MSDYLQLNKEQFLYKYGGESVLYFGYSTWYRAFKYRASLDRDTELLVHTREERLYSRDHNCKVADLDISLGVIICNGVVVEKFEDWR